MPYLCPPTLTAAEQKAILQVTAANLRDHTIFSMALGTDVRRRTKTEAARGWRVSLHPLGDRTTGVKPGDWTRRGSIGQADTVNRGRVPGGDCF